MSEQKDFEARLRDALRTEGDSAEVSPGALHKIRGRLNKPRSWWQARRTVAFGVMAAAAACTAAILVVPRLADPPAAEMAAAPAESDEGTQSGARSKDDSNSTLQIHPPSERQTSSEAPVIGELTLGEDVRLTLAYDSISGDQGSVVLAASAWKNGEWGPRSSSAAVGKRNEWPFTGSFSGHVCEFRVAQAANQSTTVRVRLAQDGGCSDAFVYQLTGTTLRPK